MRSIVTVINLNTRSQDSLLIREFEMKMENFTMFSYTDVLETIRRIYFFGHSKSVVRFTAPCIREWVVYFSILPILSNSSKLNTNQNFAMSSSICNHLYSFH